MPRIDDVFGDPNLPLGNPVTPLQCSRYYNPEEFIFETYTSARHQTARQWYQLKSTRLDHLAFQAGIADWPAKSNPPGIASDVCKSAIFSTEEERGPQRATEVNLTAT